MNILFLVKNEYEFIQSLSQNKYKNAKKTIYFLALA